MARRPVAWCLEGGSKSGCVVGIEEGGWRHGQHRDRRSVAWWTEGKEAGSVEGRVRRPEAWREG
ncbi:hypothetical protein E2562_004290 [Oryza meyeriana var. granulata]|uniref:Uncharacterized protein n=1 Tax=Oryza meyeriana var. granulata TaxID=110450 RepID=A0A6G1BQZ6_9ORYZ|nr:hypothetical protein E2562_004290 [Oryza meyeriana var. granulata]